MQPSVKVVVAPRDELPKLYAELLVQNPLLARIEGQCRAIYWLESEIRTVQLLTACASNASLTARVKELEAMLIGGG